MSFLILRGSLLASGEAGAKGCGDVVDFGLRYVIIHGQAHGVCQQVVGIRAIAITRDSGAVLKHVFTGPGNDASPEQPSLDRSRLAW